MQSEIVESVQSVRRSHGCILGPISKNSASETDEISESLAGKGPKGALHRLLCQVHLGSHRRQQLFVRFRKGRGPPSTSS